MSIPLLSALSREGVLINVSVRYWRASKKLHAEDLGLRAEDVQERLICLGRKRLLPKDALAQFALIESRTHALVEGATFPFLGGIARFLPNRKLAEVRESLARLQSEFQAAHAQFAEQYLDLREEALAEWREAARTLAVNADELVNQIEESYPDPVRLDRFFAFEVQLYEVKAPSTLRAELVSFGDQQAIVEARQRAAEEAASQMKENTESFIGECVATLRQEAANVCEDMLGAIQGGKTDGVHQKTLNRLMRFIDDFKEMNFAGDTEFEQILDNARKTLLSKTAEEYRDNASALTRLRSGLQGLARTARDLARRDASEIVERFGQMGVRKLSMVA